MINRIIKTFFIYFTVFFLFSIVLKIILYNNIKPISNTKAPRVFGIIPLREFIIIPPISFMLWFYISTKILHNKLPFSNILFESIIALFLTGIIIHKIFNVKSKLGSLLHITMPPDGTGMSPYPNY